MTRVAMAAQRPAAVDSRPGRDARARAGDSDEEPVGSVTS
jgi:hypothetical protein